MITTKFQIFKEIFDPASREKIAKFAFFFLISPALEMLYLEFRAAFQTPRIAGGCVRTKANNVLQYAPIF
jgi:hypothetical protein